MAITNFNATYTSNIDVAIPSTAFSISLVVAGASGGTGGSDSGGDGSGGGAGRRGTFTLPNYVARTLSLRPGGAGPNGPGCFGRGTVGGSGTIPGGSGGSASGCSGSGAGGGAASGVYDSVYNNWIIVAAGGGGGGGGAWEVSAISPGGNGGGWQTSIGSVSAGAGGNGASCGDGSGGGGGGGGAPGGGPGTGGCDFEQGGSGGGGGESAYNSSAATITSDSFNNGGGFISLSYTSAVPEIINFTAIPLNQYSSGGTPLYSTQLQWSTADVTSLVITSSAGETYNVTGTNNLNITNLAQSNAAGNSPVSRNYTLTACYNTVCTTSTITINAKNDNTPSNSWTQTFSNLDPSTEYQYTLGQLNGVDMPTIGSVDGTNNFLGDSIGGSFSNPKTFTNGSAVVLKFTSLPFNTDISGQTGIYGKTNVKTMRVTIGSQSFDVTATTRAPRISEDFNYTNKLSQYPFEDIDLIDNAPADYLTSAVVTADDIEIPVEIKSSDPNLQVNINGTGWQNIRST